PDVYAFVANDAPNSLTLVGNWIPFEDPAGGPNFYRFDDRADYYLNVDNTGDGRVDLRYQFKFRTIYRNKNSGIYALPGVSGLSDPKLQVIQRYNVTREVYRPNGRLRSARVIARNLPVGPNNTAAHPGERPEQRDRRQRREAARTPYPRAGRAGQPPGQPAHQRAGDPDRPQGQVQRHPAGQRRRQLRRVRRQARAGARDQRAVPGPERA